jgi:hypothetical protein
VTQTTHWIYEIQGRKVGCTSNIEGRKAWYLSTEGTLPILKILEILYDSTEQEAGDAEWEWADKLGYPRGLHYSKRPKNAKAHFVKLSQNLVDWSKDALYHEQRVEKGRKIQFLCIGIHALSVDQRQQNGRKGGFQNAGKGGRKTKELKIGIHGLSEEQSRINRSKGGSKGGAAKQGKSGAQIRVSCLFCDRVTTAINLKRHIEKCPKKLLRDKINLSIQRRTSNV